ncbi:hypothetical protein [Serratia fonticola]|uniref:Uncharacterized protein n=1 Tax=Serratia fonticola TaxID=47917 RepID=A0AAW3WR62_SERFO|nr:hypothetical protein [Serratia fonticola]MBC3212102.1 hypothetical protein [Serratia fonticola]NYA10990.1 hypothetical protein [Serratia fonticola]NYA32968.1 hypothetical protein [Serratia fonticola]
MAKKQYGIMPPFPKMVAMMREPTPKSCSIQKQNSGMINTPLSEVWR